MNALPKDCMNESVKSNSCPKSLYLLHKQLPPKWSFCPQKVLAKVTTIDLTNIQLLERRFNNPKNIDFSPGASDRRESSKTKEGQPGGIAPTINEPLF